MPPASTGLPLEGCKVLDLSRVLAGPYCTSLLSLLGAEVIKVEELSGDEARQWPPEASGVSTAFMGLNINKSSIAVDLKHPRGKEV
ncbi:MAG: CoA transferase, partial [Deltaproteobacteria bacterium]|nr:CoA transferase [Deltaproteobacteria bacterium]